MADIMVKPGSIPIRKIKLFTSYELMNVEDAVNEFINQEDIYCIETQLQTNLIESSSSGKIYTKYTIMVKYLTCPKEDV